MTKRKQKKMQQLKEKKNSKICLNGLREAPTHASYSKGI